VKEAYVLRSSCLLLVALFGACQQRTYGLDNLPCDSSGACVDGYVCNPTLNICVRPLSVSCVTHGDLCPSTIEEGSPCAVVGSFLPCVDGATSCAGGCRTCQGDLTFSACVTGGTEDSPPASHFAVTAGGGKVKGTTHSMTLSIGAVQSGTATGRNHAATFGVGATERGR
jgi:hypothetical protein